MWNFPTRKFGLVDTPLMLGWGIHECLPEQMTHISLQPHRKSPLFIIKIIQISYSRNNWLYAWISVYLSAQLPASPVGWLPDCLLHVLHENRKVEKLKFENQKNVSIWEHPHPKTVRLLCTIFIHANNILDFPKFQT